MHSSIRTLFMGTPDFAVPTLRTLLAASRFAVAAVATQPDRPAGRGNKVTMAPVKRVALEAGLPVLQPASLRKDPAAVEALRALAPDLIVVAAYGLILPPAVLEIPRYGCINVHASLLPAFRGASPIVAALLAGLPETGISIMRMDAGMDTGPVLAQASLPILPDDTSETLGERLAELGALALVPVLEEWIAGAIVPTPQSDLPGEPSVVRMIKKDAGRIDWSQPAAHIERMTRAFQPWPSAWTLWKNEPLRILRAHVGARAEIEQDTGGQGAGGQDAGAMPDSTPGRVVKRGGAIGVVVGDGVLLLDQVQPAGKRPMDAHAFANGAQSFVGSILP